MKIPGRLILIINRFYTATRLRMTAPSVCVGKQFDGYGVAMFEIFVNYRTVLPRLVVDSLGVDRVLF